jgi:DNA-binding NtrC family response regulator
MPNDEATTHAAAALTQRFFVGGHAGEAVMALIASESGSGRGRLLHAAASTGCNRLGTIQFLGEDPKVRAVRELVAQVAATDATVLIYGESGTGKELIARSLQQQSARRNAAFIALNCGCIADSLIESEMFGHSKGAFTGAESAQVGRFEAAHRGTIFLDEVSEMSRSLQVALLRILQTGDYTPVGSVETRFCDVRVIGATNCELEPLIEQKKFRQDLFYRLNIIRIDLPPLRERRGDIPALVNHFLNVFADAYGKPGLEITTEAREFLLGLDYPGNVRELENLVRRAVVLCRDHPITLEHIRPERHDVHRVSATTEPSGYHSAREHALQHFDRTYLISALRECGGIVSRAARLVGLSERTFHKKLAEYDIDFRSFRR